MRRERDGFALQQDLPLVCRVGAGDDVDQRRFAGSVLAEDDMDLTPAQVEVDIPQGDDAGEALGDASELEDYIAALSGCSVAHARITTPAGRAAPRDRWPRGTEKALPSSESEAPVRAEHGLEVSGRERRGVDEELLQVVVLTGCRAADELHRWTDPPEPPVERLVLQDSDRLVDGHAGLDDCLVVARARDLACFDRGIDLGNDVVRDHLDLVLQVARGQRLSGCGRGHCGAGNEVHVGEGIQSILDKARLHVLARVTVPGRQDLHLAALDRVAEALVRGFHPACTGRPREPADADLLRLAQLRQVLARHEAHVVVADERMRLHVRRADAVDDVDHDLPLLAQLRDLGVEAGVADGSDHERVGPGRCAVVQLIELLGQVRVATRLDQLHLRMVPLALLHRAVVDCQPVRVLQVRERDADLPGLLDLRDRKRLVHALDLLGAVAALLACRLAVDEFRGIGPVGLVEECGELARRQLRRRSRAKRHHPGNNAGCDRHQGKLRWDHESLESHASSFTSPLPAPGGGWDHHSSRATSASQSSRDLVNLSQLLRRFSWRKPATGLARFPRFRLGRRADGGRARGRVRFPSPPRSIFHSSAEAPPAAETRRDAMTTHFSAIIADHPAEGGKPRIRYRYAGDRDLQQVHDELPAEREMTIPSRLVHLPVAFDDSATRQGVQRYIHGIRSDAPNCEGGTNVDYIVRYNGFADREVLYDAVLGTEQWTAFIGFFPGLPFMFPLDPRAVVFVPKYNPTRTWTPEGALGIGGPCYAIYP